MFKLKEWATPLTIGTFIISAITGILIFFHLNTGLVKPAHEWFSWLFVFAVVFHVLINWKIFTQHLSRPVAVGIIAFFTILTIISVTPIGNSKKHSLAKVLDALNNAPIESVARISGQAPEVLLNNLRKQGLTVDNVQKTISEIAKENNKGERHLLGSIF